jgi:muramoyltetrapeptide carboxypeptidase
LIVDIKESTLPWGRDDREITMEYFDCPIYFNFPAGHVPDNRALIMGRSIRIEIESEKVKFKFIDASTPDSYRDSMT